MTGRFSKILIANRGEIACRVIRTAKAEGYETVAVFSDADHDALHVKMADEAVCIGPAPATESYLNGGRILVAAKQCGADAIHPGYGFLSENADFAAACAEAGITFIGPTSAAIRAMGNKAEAKRCAAQAGVSCVPGYDETQQDNATLKAEVERIGYPVLLKAVAGGGGRGMRVVRHGEELEDALASARAEAKSAFGSGDLLVEKLLEKVRHVEIQLIADTHGNCIHLGERDCSIQRRHQKLIEESPCPVMTPALREAMGRAATEVAQAAGYVNAGTVEFLLDSEENFYFLEMNTRLQVEHPVTEWVTGLDLVSLQLLVAQGEALPLAQADVVFQGHAFEARLYAEDPACDFAPQLGTIHAWTPPEGRGVRVDHALAAGTEITPWYDAMLAKIVAWGTTREAARARLRAALRDTTLLGVPCNTALLSASLEHPDFVSGEAHTNFLDVAGNLVAPASPPDGKRLLIAAAVLVERDGAGISPLLKGWRSTGQSRTPLRLAWEEIPYSLALESFGNSYSLTHEGATASLQVIAFDTTTMTFEEGGHRRNARYATAGDDLYVSMDGRTDHFNDITYAPPAEKVADGDGVLKAPMVGQVVALHVGVGDRVGKDDILVVLEAMKMVNQITAPFRGTVGTLNIALGDRVDARQALMTLVEDKSDGQNR